MSSCTISERKLSNCSRKDESWEDSCCHTRCASVLEGRGGREGRKEGRWKREMKMGGREGERKGKDGDKREILYI